MLGPLIGVAARAFLPRALARLLILGLRVRQAKRVIGWATQDLIGDHEESVEDLTSPVLWREAQDELEDEEDREDLTGPP